MNEIKNIETSVKSVFEINPKQLKHFSKFEKLLSELEKKELTQDVVFKINHEVEKVNTIRVARKENPVLLKKAK